jgi:sugar phosphate permease
MCLSRSGSEQRLAAERERTLYYDSKATPTVHFTPRQQHITSRGESGGKDKSGESDLADLLAPDEEEAPNLQWREFALVYIAYMGFLVSRKNYGFWLRPVISELGYAKGQAGLIGSTLEVTYGTCSFLNGVVIDSRSPKHLLIGGLLLSALANLCVAGTESLPLMVVVWGLNGAVQSVGWPSVTNVFLAWFPDPAARGAWYSLLSTCQNAGAALVPLLVSAFVSLYGWRAALYAPAVASVCIALLLGLCLYGSPAAAANAEPSLKAKPSPADLAHTMRQQVFLNPALWLMAASYFGCSMVRTCLQDWTSLYLHEAKGMPIATSARCLFLWELGGFAGTFAAGFISDRVFGGRRGPVVCICCALLAPSLVLLLHTTSPGLVQVRHARQTAALTPRTPHHTRPPQTSMFPLFSSPLSSVACHRGAICGWGSAPSQCTCCSASSLARPCRPPSPPPPAVSSR